ncbi:MAG TPA: class I SAM-dependent methyltransferase, partial [Caulobacteraceae bacterium]|nr:class I SAM-dependent methyltransferase [Caulobacteraceae bacterium]
KQREKVTPLAEGVVLELGFGSGLNLPHYDRARIKQLIALEPAPGMLARAEKAAAVASFPVSILPEKAEALSLPPASVDTVLVTFSLCTIPDPVTALQGARRALKPGGRLIFCEHGKAPDADVQKSQARIEPFWEVIAGGCHLCRDIPRLICDGGFEVETLETMYLPGTPRWAGFNYWGSAKPVG